MTEQATETLTEILGQIRDRAAFGLNSDVEGARNALTEIAALCEQALNADAANPDPISTS
jgi:hypothetical protein